MRGLDGDGREVSEDGGIGPFDAEGGDCWVWLDWVLVLGLLFGDAGLVILA